MSTYVTQISLSDICTATPAIARLPQVFNLMKLQNTVRNCRDMLICYTRDDHLSIW